MTKADRDYVRLNPDGLSRRELAARFGVSKDTIHGIVKKRRNDVDLEKWLAEASFVEENTHLLTDEQIVATLLRCTGKRFSVFWVRRVRRQLLRRRQSEPEAEQFRDTPGTRREPASPWSPLDFGDL